jgi:hypothetical protein
VDHATGKAYTVPLEMLQNRDRRIKMDLSLGYLIEAIVVIGGVATATFLAKRQFRKRNKLAF